MTIAAMKQKGLLLFECISGSKAYGLDTTTSDTDIKGVFYLPKEQFYGLEYIAQINSDSHDEVYYELGRFVELLLKNNPNMLELLATPEDCVLYRHPLMEQLSIDMFLSGLCRDTFGGYAATQIRKARGLNKKIVNPVEKERKNVLDFCFVVDGYVAVPLKEYLVERGWIQEYCGLSKIAHSKGLYALFYDGSQQAGYSGIVSSEQANEVALSSIAVQAQQYGYLYFNSEGYSAYCKEYKEYWEWVEKRNEVRYQDNQAHGKDYDAKNMMHTIRLLQVAEEIGREGKLQVKRPDRDYLLSVKAGHYAYEALLQEADKLMYRIDLAYANSLLPSLPEQARAVSILVAMREALYR